eukprot:1943663-Pyramimonas_sp.AAC.1
MTTRLRPSRLHRTIHLLLILGCPDQGSSLETAVSMTGCPHRGASPETVVVFAEGRSGQHARNGRHAR